MDNLDYIQGLITDKDFNQAEKELLKHLQENEKDKEALKLLGLCYVNLGNTKRDRIYLKL